MAHPSKDGVDKFMLHIKKAVNLRAEAELSLGSYAANKLREESKDALRDAEYMVYELIDGAVERSKNQGGNIPPAKEMRAKVDYSLGQGEHWVPQKREK